MSCVELRVGGCEGGRERFVDGVKRALQYMHYSAFVCRCVRGTITVPPVHFPQQSTDSKMLLARVS